MWLCEIKKNIKVRFFLISKTIRLQFLKFLVYLKTILNSFLGILNALKSHS